MEAFVEVGRTFGLMVLGLVALIGCIALYWADKTTGATALLAVSEAILFTGFGVQLGERTGEARAWSDTRQNAFGAPEPPEERRSEGSRSVH